MKLFLLKSLVVEVQHSWNREEHSCLPNEYDPKSRHAESVSILSYCCRRDGRSPLSMT